MKKYNFKKITNILFKFFLSLLLIIGVSLIPASMIFSKIKENSFLVVPSYSQQIMELWNIDTFEGGTSSKSSFLSNLAIDFEKYNRGCYIMVKNKTLTECLLALEQGQFPILFSFGLQAGKSLEPYLKELTLHPAINSVFLNSGVRDKKLYASPWCYGVYSLISTKDIVKENKISSLASLLGESKKLRNGKIKTTYSITFGEKVTRPTGSYMANFGNLVNLQNGYDTKNFEKSAYESYCDFIEGKAKILLGTQRDIVRIENRVALGKLQDVVYEPLGKFTDLVQYIGVCSLSNDQNSNVSNKFIEFLTSNSNLQKLSSIGMFAPIDNQSLYFDGVYKDLQIAANNITEIPNIFGV